jgi:hypothetical protein
MSKHRRVERTDRDVVCDRIVERVAALVDPWTEQHAQHVPPAMQTSAERETWEGPADDPWPGAVPRLVVRTTTVEHPALLEQLLAPTTGSTAGISSSGPASRPPSSLEGLAAHEDIQHGTQTWARALFGQLVPSGPGARLRRLAEHAPLLPDDRLRNLDADVTRWWVLARTVTTWADPPWKPHVPCSECGVLGKIQVRLYPTTAYCLECGTAWDSQSVGALGTHVQLVVEQAAAVAAERAIERRPCTTCGHEHAPGDYPDADSYQAHLTSQVRGRTADVVGRRLADAADVSRSAGHLV